LVASYLARARGSNEPELSIARCKDLDQFIRETKSFQLDHGHVQGPEHDDQLNGFRQRFEELLGNASGCDHFVFSYGLCILNRGLSQGTETVTTCLILLFYCYCFTVTVAALSALCC